MAQTFLTPDIIAKQALATLSETLVMKPLIHTDLTKEFSAAKVGDTINVRKPATFESKKFDRSKGIEIQEANEGSVPVKLDQFDDVSFAVTSEELALEIADFDEQLLTPAMGAIARGVDNTILTMRDGLEHQVDTATWPLDDPTVLLNAGQILDENLVPLEDRAAVIGPALRAKWNAKDIIKRADQSSTTEGLRKASLGKNLFGFDVYATNNIKAEEEGERGLAFHKSAFAFGSAPLEVPAGAHGYVATHNGLSIRCVMQYDITKKSTTVSLDLLYGVKLLDPARAVLLAGKAG